MRDERGQNKRQFSKNQLIKLFLGCIFPIHGWAIFVFLGHSEWLNQRNGGIALSVLAYFLSIALIESILIFLLIYLASFFIPTKWIPGKKLLFLVLASWSICLGFILAQILDSYLQNLVNMWFWLSITILALIVIIEKLLEKKGFFARFIEDFVDRVTVLSAFFLAFDFLGVITVIFRNLK